MKAVRTSLNEAQYQKFNEKRRKINPSLTDYALTKIAIIEFIESKPSASNPNLSKVATKKLILELLRRLP